MIIDTPEEKVVDLIGTKHIVFDELIGKANKIKNSFAKIHLDSECEMPIYPNADKNLIINGLDGQKSSDMTAYAFSQTCDLIGVPAKYMRKLYDQDLSDIVSMNVRAQYGKKKAGSLGHFIALVSGNTTEAIVSDKYSFDFQTPEMLETIQENIPSCYVPNQAYLSNSRCHVRFIDADNRVKVGGEDMTVGFTVGTSDIGKSALTVKFFLYKFACKNGIVRIGKGGTLYRQLHIGNSFSEDSIEEFKHCFSDIEYLRENSLDLIAASQNRMMSITEMQSIIDTCKKSGISISEKESAKIIDLAANRYGRTKWGLINGVTEVAQDHTLDTRIAYEMFAGRILEKTA